MKNTSSLRELLTNFEQLEQPGGIRPQPHSEEIDCLVQVKIWLTLDEIALYIDQTKDLAVKAQWMQIFLTEWQRQCGVHDPC